MKRYLLIAMAVGASLTSMAQNEIVLTKSSVSETSLLTPKKAEFSPKFSPAVKALKIETTGTRVNKVMKKANEVAYPYGEVIVSDNKDGVTDYLGEDGNPETDFFTSVATSTLEKVEETLEDGTVLNVHIPAFDGYIFELYGVYDEEAGTITLPLQTCYTSESYGDCALYAYNEGDEYYSDLVFTKNKDGIFESTQTWQVLIDNEESPYYHYYLVMGSEPKLLNPNGQSSFTYPANTGRSTDTRRVFIEDYETEIAVYGIFMGYSNASYTEIGFDDDLTAYIYGAQRVGLDDMSSEIIKSYPQFEGSFFSYMRLWDYVEEDGEQLISDGDIVGKLSGNTVTFTGPFTVGSGYVQNVGALTYGEIRDLNITIDTFFAINGEQPGEETGIEDFNTTREYKIKNTNTYNLMGQQVNRKAVKGLMIRDGKKYIAK